MELSYQTGTSQSEGTLPLPPQRGRLLVIVREKLRYVGVNYDAELKSSAAIDKEKNL